jgi:hypothetical protein
MGLSAQVGEAAGDSAAASEPKEKSPRVTAAPANVDVFKKSLLDCRSMQ